MAASHAMKNYQTGGFVGPDLSLSQQHAPAQRHIRIAPPQMSANAQKVIAQAMAMPSQNWGAAISKLANVWAANRAGEREAEAKAQEASELQSRRQGWGAKLGDGMTQRDLAALDPQFIEDAKYQAFLKGTAPAPDPETFETVQDPFGRGGAAQQSSLTGKFANYQGPLATPPAPQRRIVKGLDNLNYYEDSKERVLPNVLAPTPEPVATGPSMPDQLKMVRQLSDDWRETVKPMQTLLDQSDRMNIGFEQAQAGDMLSGSQAILISFNKLLDPTSVVRESEYARSATGQSALETLKGMADKLARGGAGVTLGELASYRRFGEQVVANTLKTTVGPERKRIERLIEFAGVDPSLVFTGRFATPEGPQQTAPPQAPMVQALEPEPELASSHAMMAPTGQAGPAPRVAPAPDQARVSMYGQLDPAALRRQAAEMTGNPDTYSDEEKRAMSRAWFKAFGE